MLERKRFGADGAGHIQRAMILMIVTIR